MKNAVLTELWSRLERVSTLTDDDLEARRRKVTLVVMTAICFVASIIWGTLYLAILGPTLTALITYGFTVVIGAALAAFLASKRFGLLLYPFFVMILWNPIAMQWSLGGFAASGVLMTWSLLAPICALMFQTLFRRSGRELGQAVGSSHVDAVLRHEPDRSLGGDLSFHAVLRAGIPARARALRKPAAEVTILFADIIDFTGLSARVTPEELVTILNTVFSAFDRLSERHGLEKIKTIGDAYMVAGGLPEPRPDHAEAVAEMALDMQSEIDRLGAELGRPLGLRIGIDSGAVVAGVIGTRKFAYDLWGDAVNTASRMESQGVANGIQLTEGAYRRLRDTHICEDRGVIDVKGKGVLQTYLLKGKKC
jgi:guanylate cyclase